MVPKLTKRTRAISKKPLKRQNEECYDTQFKSLVTSSCRGNVQLSYDLIESSKKIMVFILICIVTIEAFTKHFQFSLRW